MSVKYIWIKYGCIATKMWHFQPKSPSFTVLVLIFLSQVPFSLFTALNLHPACQIFCLLNFYWWWRTFKAATWYRSRREMFPEILPIIPSCWQLMLLTRDLHKKLKFILKVWMRNEVAWSSRWSLRAVRHSCSPAKCEQSTRNHHHHIYILHQI